MFPSAKSESSVCFTSLPVLGIVGLFNVSNLVRHEWSLSEAHICPPLWPPLEPLLPPPHVSPSGLTSSFLLSSCSFHNWPLLGTSVTSSEVFPYHPLQWGSQHFLSHYPVFFFVVVSPIWKKTLLFVYLLTACPIRTLAPWTKTSCLFLPRTVPDK